MDEFLYGSVKNSGNILPGMFYSLHEEEAGEGVGCTRVHSSHLNASKKIKIYRMHNIFFRMISIFEIKVSDFFVRIRS